MKFKYLLSFMDQDPTKNLKEKILFKARYLERLDEIDLSVQELKAEIREELDQFQESVLTKLNQLNHEAEEEE